MRDLSYAENHFVSGGDYLDQNTNYDIFWKSFAAASGAGSGYICSIPVALLMCVYGTVYYGVYTPAYYGVAATYYVGSMVGNGIYNVGEYAANAVIG